MSLTTDLKTSNARWIQLLLGVIAMMAISSPQYVWTLFVKSFQTTTGATLPAIQITFSLVGPSFGQVAWAAHIVGFIAGVVFALASREAISRRQRNL